MTKTETGVAQHQSTAIIWAMIIVGGIASGWIQLTSHQVRQDIQRLDARIAAAKQTLRECRSIGEATIARNLELTALVQRASSTPEMPLPPDEDYVRIFNRRSRYNDLTWFTVPRDHLKLTVRVHDTLLQDTSEFVYPLRAATVCKLEFSYDFDVDRKLPPLTLLFDVDTDTEPPICETLPVARILPSNTLHTPKTGVLTATDFSDAAISGRESQVTVTSCGWLYPIPQGASPTQQTEVRITAFISSD